jgi:hypothetical protein
MRNAIPCFTGLREGDPHREESRNHEKEVTQAGTCFLDRSTPHRFPQPPTEINCIFNEGISSEITITEPAQSLLRQKEQDIPQIDPEPFLSILLQ